MSKEFEQQAFPMAMPDDSMRGMTLRQYYKAHAPSDPQAWFTPSMPYPRPKLMNWRDIEDEKVRRDVDLAWSEGLDAETPEGQAWMEAQLEIEAKAKQWDTDYKRAQYVQWPGAYAEAMLAEDAEHEGRGK